MPREYASPAPWGDLLRRHRSAWVDSLAGDLPAREVRSTSDIHELLDESQEARALVWFDDYPGDGDRQRTDEALRAVAAAGHALVVALVAASDGGAARHAAGLASELGGMVVAQHLSAGSVIVDGPGPVGATISESPEPDDAVAYLVCSNVEADLVRKTGTMLGAAAVPLMSGYIKFLHAANEELRHANARLAREHLGVHDSAAASLAPRISELEKELAEQRRIAQDHYDMLLQAKATLEAPRYRAVDAGRAFLFKIPGLSAALRLRSRLVQRARQR
jgi:hypothetical protein